MPQSSSTFINEYTLPDVVENSSSRASKMTIKEYKRIGEGAFGTVVEAMLKYETNSSKGMMALGHICLAISVIIAIATRITIIQPATTTIITTKMVNG